MIAGFLSIPPAGAGQNEPTQTIWTIGGLTMAERYKLFVQQPATTDDIAILKRADEILSSEDVWNRAGSRECSRLADSWSLFCALKEASIEVVGKYDNRRVAMEELRFVIIEVTGLDNKRPNVHPS